MADNEAKDQGDTPDSPKGVDILTGKPGAAKEFDWRDLVNKTPEERNIDLQIQAALDALLLSKSGKASDYTYTDGGSRRFHALAGDDYRGLNTPLSLGTPEGFSISNAEHAFMSPAISMSKEELAQLYANIDKKLAGGKARAEMQVIEAGEIEPMSAEAREKIAKLFSAPIVGFGATAAAAMAQSAFTMTMNAKPSNTWKTHAIIADGLTLSADALKRMKGIIKMSPMPSSAFSQIVNNHFQATHESLKHADIDQDPTYAPLMAQIDKGATLDSEVGLRRFFAAADAGQLEEAQAMLVQPKGQKAGGPTGKGLKA